MPNQDSRFWPCNPKPLNPAGRVGHNVYRIKILEKMKLHSLAGIVIYAIKQNLYKLN
jgi:hypothetical protein